jgi:hypothetical protein
MMSDRADDTRVDVILACALIISCFLPCSPAEATRRREDPALIHARACVGELGWRAPDEACSAIVEVHMRRAALRGWRPETVARLYSAALRRPPRGRMWVPQLRPGRRPPMAWPGLPWARYERRLREIVEVVRGTLDGEAPESCPDAVHYGGAMDAVPTGHVEACRWAIGRGSQRFYARTGDAS